MKYIGVYTFSECASLIEITVPRRVSIIRDSAFVGCRSLVSILIPRSVDRIESFVFWGCSSLREIYYSGSAEEWSALGDLTNAYIPKDVTMYYDYR